MNKVQSDSLNVGDGTLSIEGSPWDNTILVGGQGPCGGRTYAHQKGQVRRNCNTVSKVWTGLSKNVGDDPQNSGGPAWGNAIVHGGWGP